MLRSMTGYARVVGGEKGDSHVWEIRAVNHRYLETVLHLPETRLGLEGEIRQRVGQVIKRGRVEIWLRQESRGEPNLQVDSGLLQGLRHAAGQAAELWGAPLPLPSALDLLRWPGVLQAQAVDLSTEQLLALLDAALAELQATRAREGEALASILRHKLNSMGEILTMLQGQLPLIETRLRERLDRRLGELRQQVEPARWEQELVFYLHRQDVAEEMERLATHLQEFRQTLERDEPVGRRLDFLVQECNREANTLGSKAGDQQVSQAAIELKVLIEQIREQIQNVE
ncbi:MAG: YicC/YloC family endoribonuclease [Candidatus Igneacidithiobacillus chanchocoensis]